MNATRNEVEYAVGLTVKYGTWCEFADGRAGPNPPDEHWFVRCSTPAVVAGVEDYREESAAFDVQGVAWEWLVARGCDPVRADGLCENALRSAEVLRFSADPRTADNTAHDED
jgi:hypothetical protein